MPIQMLIQTSVLSGFSARILRCFRPSILFAVLLGIGLIQPGNAETTRVYKTVHPDGSISYSDQPSDRAEVMDVQPVETVPAYRGNTSAPSAATRTTSPPSNFYRSLSIVKPTNESAFWSGNGAVEIEIALQPALRKNDRVRISLDGELLKTSPIPRATLSNIDRGTHQLLVQVVDAQGEVLQAAQSTFTLHRPTVKRTAN